jgi:glycosyltransferase involved in cell wall biosynthesis
MTLPRITLLVDYPNWAFDYVAKSIAKRLKNRFRFKIKYTSFKDKLNPNKTDLIYVFFWGEQWYKEFGFDKSQIIKEVASLRWKYDDQYGKISIDEFIENYLYECSLITTPSLSIHRMLRDHVDNLFHCPNGVDTNIFYPDKYIKSFKNLRIGWVGNPDDACKGLKDLLLPASMDYNFRFTNGKLSRYQLSKFYRKIDVLTIASISESQPLPLLESMASGCFPIATDVGIVPEIVTHKNNGLIVDRNIESFRKAFKWCTENLNYIRSVGSYNRLIAEKRSWGYCAERFGDIFDYAFSKKNGSTFQTPNPVFKFDNKLPRPLQNEYILQDCNMRVKFFKFSTRATSLPPKFHTSRVTSERNSSRDRSQKGPFHPDFGVRAHLSIYIGMGSRILAPFLKLKANCRNMISMLFLMIFVNLARWPLSCRWLIPKYCSTMYLNFEMALFRRISLSVSLAVMESFRMMPSLILFKAKKRRLGPPAYPLSA